MTFLSIAGIYTCPGRPGGLSHWELYLYPPLRGWACHPLGCSRLGRVIQFPTLWNGPRMDLVWTSTASLENRPDDQAFKWFWTSIFSSHRCNEALMVDQLIFIIGQPCSTTNQMMPNDCWFLHPQFWSVHHYHFSSTSGVTCRHGFLLLGRNLVRVEWLGFVAMRDTDESWHITLRLYSFPR